MAGEDHLGTSSLPLLPTILDRAPEFCRHARRCYDVNSPMMHVVRKFAGTVLPGIVKPLRVLWNEVIGFMFLVLGVIFGFSAWRKYKEFSGDFASLLLLIMAGFFVVLMIGYGLSSFLRARRIGRG